MKQIIFLTLLIGLTLQAELKNNLEELTLKAKAKGYQNLTCKDIPYVKSFMAPATEKISYYGNREKIAREIQALYDDLNLKFSPLSTESETTIAKLKSDAEKLKSDAEKLKSDAEKKISDANDLEIAKKATKDALQDLLKAKRKLENCTFKQ